MSPQNIFGIATRCLGLLFCYQAVTHLLFYLDYRLGFSTPVDYNPNAISTGYLTYVVAYAVLGIFLLRSTDYVIAFTYDIKTEDADEDLPAASSGDSEGTGRDEQTSA